MRATELHFVWSPLRLVWVSSLVPLFVHHVLLKLKKFLEISEAFQEVRNLKFQYVVPEAYVTSCYRYHTTSKVSET
jgi:hypothetical protein